MNKINTNHHFSKIQIEAAFTRQGFLCGSCGEGFYSDINSRLLKNGFGESKHAHHIQPKIEGGKSIIDNCVILCQSCHYNAHEGGKYKKGTFIGRQTDFPYYAFTNKDNIR